MALWRGGEGNFSVDGCLNGWRNKTFQAQREDHTSRSPHYSRIWWYVQRFKCMCNPISGPWVLQSLVSSSIINCCLMKWRNIAHKLPKMRCPKVSQTQTFPCIHLRVNKGVLLSTAHQWLIKQGFIIQSTKKQFIMMVMIDLMLWNINRRCSCHRSKVIGGDWLSSKLGKLIKKLSRTFPNVFRDWSCVHIMTAHVRPMMERSGVGLWKGSSQLRRRKPGMVCIWVK